MERDRNGCNSWSPPGRRNNGTSEAGDGVARRLLRLPHVVPRPGRVPDRPGRPGRHRLQPAHGHQGVSRRRGPGAGRRSGRQRGEPAHDPPGPRADRASWSPSATAP